MLRLRFARGLAAAGLVAAWSPAGRADDGPPRPDGRDTFLWAMSKHASGAA